MHISDTIASLLSRVPVIDVHSDYAIQLYREMRDGRPDALAALHLPMLREGGISMEVHTVGGDFDIGELDLWDYELVKRISGSLLESIAASPDLFRLILTAEDVRGMQQRGALGLMMALEGVRCLEQSTDRLHELHALGLRSVIFTHNHRNGAADGCSEPEPRGLSAFGRTLVEELRSLRMVLDLVHLSVPSFWDALGRWNAPVMVSHSNARALCPHARNLDDEQIRAVGESGGVIGLNFLSLFIDENRSRADLDRLADHAVHIAGIAGAEALALGPDFADYYMDAMDAWIRRDNLPADLMAFVKGAEDVRGVPAFLETLYNRGFTLEEIERIAGRNALRVYENCFTP
ncbi:MAG: dipeptidase [Bacteroidia bacterium]|nr:dipeptidase [Bacteroidia bacterium]